MVASVKEAAAKVGVHPRTVERWIAAGVVRAWQLVRGGVWRLPLNAEGRPMPARRRCQ